MPAITVPPLSVLYGHARDLVSVLVNDDYRIPIPVIVLSNFPCNTGSVSLRMFGIRELLADGILARFIREGVAVADVEERARRNYP